VLQEFDVVPADDMGANVSPTFELYAYVSIFQLVGVKNMRPAAKRASMAPYTQLIADVDKIP
jgi:hypothetical protein